ncbi:unnamed protein product (macronuclear) [Paramecium tetraurelia]|uniref:Uncharacterized protein n=1 Tax=Paramecium tetraurelia TaxID=5888 RepID=A0D0H9_PARTE|nr:uncharacterized protein GSPATT00012098001 [Paramecium tetraurelia]CAK76546.1 unnamed protein product [Paramecium tetraurelia]|eukprot:XP_001443943.1 hypothetical protein (macronuclear) [Paramecium tetraurelia strain d4-2]
MPNSNSKVKLIIAESPMFPWNEYKPAPLCIHNTKLTNFSTREDEVIKTQVSETNFNKVTNLRIRIDPKSETDVKILSKYLAT